MVFVQAGSLTWVAHAAGVHAAGVGGGVGGAGVTGVTDGVGAAGAGVGHNVQTDPGPDNSQLQPAQ